MYLLHVNYPTTGCGDIAYCLVGYFILGHPVYYYTQRQNIGCAIVQNAIASIICGEHKISIFNSFNQHDNVKSSN